MVVNELGGGYLISSCIRHVINDLDVFRDDFILVLKTKIEGNHED